MHIVQFFCGEIPPSGYGGIERIVFWLTRELVALGHKVTVIASPPSTIGDCCPQTTFIPFAGDVDYRKLLPRDADIVHLHQVPPEGLLPDIPFLVTEHGNRKRGRFVPNTVFLSRSHAENHNARFFVYNGIPTEEYPLQARKEDYLLYLAKLNWRAKNAKTAIHLSMDNALPLVLTGGDLLRARKTWGSWVFRYPFKHRLIRNAGEVDGPEKLKLLQNALALFYLVKWQEPFALAPHEALSCGTPVLATPNGALSEYIQDGKNGFLVRSYGQACDALKHLQDMSSAERARMAEYCRASAFSIRDCALKYLEFYEIVWKEGFLYPEAECAGIRFNPKDSIVVEK